MRTRLLAWNPKMYRSQALNEELRDVEAGKYPMRWSVGNVKNIAIGDRVFVIRLGLDPRGIVGAGWATSRPYPFKHWNPERAAKGEMTNSIEINLEHMQKEPVVAQELLRNHPALHGFQWSTQMSGVSIPDDVAEGLETLWAGLVPLRDTGFPDESNEMPPLMEGEVKSVFVNRYERCSEARTRCLEHYGRSCAVCGMTFRQRYGAAAERLIQVHHLNPLGLVHAKTEIDPVRDMRPLCANCHVVVHLTSPPLTIEAAQAMFRRTGDEA